MTTKPPNLIYGVEDHPPLALLLVLGVQHIFLMSSSLVLPVVLISEIGGSFDEVRAVVSLTMIACGLGTILQAMRWKGIGSGFLCPNLCGPNFFAASVEAAWLGGLPLMRGMTIVAGLVEIVFARFASRLKVLFPPEITGLVVLMVAFGIIPLSVSKCLGLQFEGEPIRVDCVFVAAATLLAMVGVNIWGGRRLRLYSLIIGMVAGYALSAATGLLTGSQFHGVVDARWVALPTFDGYLQFSFRWSLLPTFVIVSICGALKTFGNLILCEKINDPDWREPDMKRIGDGLMADALCVAASGALGGVASDTSASNVAFSGASGATSRRIGYAAGALFIILGFSPKLGALLGVMPVPVMGAILLFVVSFMVVSGMQIIIQSGMDTRKTFTIGVPLIFGLSVEALPQMYAGVAPWLRPFFDSSLSLSTILAVILHQVLRIGAAPPAKAP